MDIEDILAEGKSSGSEDEKPRAKKVPAHPLSGWGCVEYVGSGVQAEISIDIFDHDEYGTPLEMLV